MAQLTVNVEDLEDRVVDNLPCPSRKNQVPLISVYRMITPSYQDSRGNLNFKRTLRHMRRLSDNAFDILGEEASACDVEFAIEQILNFHDVDDGLYIAHPSYGHDEYGHIDEVEYHLVPYKEPEDGKSS